ncbi:hypothetical protein [Mycobacterium sp. NPDC050441]|uniref:hypothetical protein n=1 Tax=Mycobacterium sp. NPDC050441 TaxID=3155403 RepID=UPI0033EAEC06
MRGASWVLLALTGCAVLGLLYGSSFPGEPSDAFYFAALALVPLFVSWCVVGIALRRKAGRWDRVLMVASPALVITGIVLVCTSVPLHLHWRMAQPSFDRALQTFTGDAAFGRHPGHIAGYPIEYIARRTDNFVDFTYRDDQNGWNGFAYSVDGNAPQTEHKSSGDYVIASAKRLGAHWFAFQSYHTMH